MIAMQPKEILRVCDYLDAVHADDTARQDALLEPQQGEIATPVLLAQFGEGILHMLLPAHFGIHDGMSDDEYSAAMDRMEADPTVKVCRVLTETLSLFAHTATRQQARGIAAAIHDYLLAISNATSEEITALFESLRDSARREEREAGGDV